jgi:hypothetical protein
VSEYLVEAAANNQIVRPFGDLVVLVNPAFEAARYQALHSAIISRSGFAVYQRPTFVSVTAKNDQATGKAFPLGRWANTRFESVREIVQKGQPRNAQRQAILNTMGHLKWLVTHELAAQETTVPQAQWTYRGRTRPYRDEEADFDEFNRDYRPGGHLRDKWVRKYSSGAVLRHVAGDPDCPYWSVAATPEVIDGHNGIFKHIFVDFIRAAHREKSRAVKCRS